MVIKKDMLNREKKIKVVFLGDKGSGKTSLASNFLGTEIERPRLPTIFQNYSTELVRKDVGYHFSFWDVNSSPKYYKLRSACYKNTDVIVLCFRVNDTKMKENLGLWLKEIEHLGNIPVILCGTGGDERNQRTETFEGMKRLTQNLGCTKYIETSKYSKQSVESLRSEIIKLNEKRHGGIFRFCNFCSCC